MLTKTDVSIGEKKEGKHKKMKLNLGIQLNDNKLNKAKVCIIGKSCKIKVFYQ